MKKLLMVLICLVMLLAVSTTAVVASGLDQDNKKSTVLITYSHTDATYVVNIPSNFEFTGKDSVVNTEVNATNVVLNSTDTLLVKVNSTNGWTLNYLNPSDSTVYKFKYIMEYQFDGATAWRSNNAGDLNEYVVLQVPAGIEAKKTPMKFTQIQAAPSTGTYSDTLTFTLSVVPTTNIANS